MIRTDMKKSTTYRSRESAIDTHFGQRRQTVEKSKSEVRSDDIIEGEFYPSEMPSFEKVVAYFRPFNGQEGFEIPYLNTILLGCGERTQSLQFLYLPKNGNFLSVQSRKFVVPPWRYLSLSAPAPGSRLEDLSEVPTLDYLLAHSPSARAQEHGFERPPDCSIVLGIERSDKTTSLKLLWTASSGTEFWDIAKRKPTSAPQRYVQLSPGNSDYVESGFPLPIDFLQDGKTIQ
jgi:hypothetical protein